MWPTIQIFIFYTNHKNFHFVISTTKSNWKYTQTNTFSFFKPITLSIKSFIKENNYIFTKTNTSTSKTLKIENWRSVLEFLYKNTGLCLEMTLQVEEWILVNTHFVRFLFIWVCTFEVLFIFVSFRYTYLYWNDFTFWVEFTLCRIECNWDVWSSRYNQGSRNDEFGPRKRVKRARMNKWRNRRPPISIA